MATRREINFTIDENGEIHIAVKGVQGDACDLLTREIELALGQVTSKTHTAEYWQQADATQQLGDGEG